MKLDWQAPGKEPNVSGILPVDFLTTICRVSTMADRGFRVWLDIPDTETPAAAKLLTLQKQVLRCRIEAEPGT